MNILESKIWVGLACTMLFSSESMACSCDDPDIPEWHENASVVFVGDVSKKSTSHSLTENMYVFVNLKVYKGEQLTSVSLWSNKFSPACGLDFKEGLRYVVFAYKDGNRLIASRCSSWQISDEYKRNYSEAFYRFYQQ